MPGGADELKFGLKMTLEDDFSPRAANTLKALREIDETLGLCSDDMRALYVATQEGRDGLKEFEEQAKPTAEELKRLAKEAREAEERLNKMTREIDQAGNAFLVLGGIIQGVFVLGATKGLKLLIDEEKTLAGLTGWLGDTGEAYRTLGEARAFAYEAGFAEAEITGGDPLLLAMGVDPKNIAHARTVISDLARSMGKEYTEALQATTSGTFGLYRSLRYTFGVDIKAEDFEEAGRFVGMTVIDALEQVFRERGKEVGELTEDFADTMTAQLARVQTRFDEVLREGTRALFDAIGDDLDSLLDWFDKAAESGELQDMISGLAAGFEVVFEVVHNLLGVFTGLMDFFGAENVAKVAAFVAKWAIFTGVATKVASGILSIAGAVQKAGGVMAWFAANPATAWIAAIGTAIGVIMLLTEAFEEVPLDELAEDYEELTKEVEAHRERAEALEKELDKNRARQKELNEQLQNAVDLSPSVVEGIRSEQEQLALKNGVLRESIELEKELMKIKAAAAYQKLLASWETLGVPAESLGVIKRIQGLAETGGRAKEEASRAYEAGEITFEQYENLDAYITATKQSYKGAEIEAAEALLAVYQEAETARTEREDLRAIAKGYKDIYEPEELARLRKMEVLEEAQRLGMGGAWATRAALYEEAETTTVIPPPPPPPPPSGKAGAAQAAAVPSYYDISALQPAAVAAGVAWPKGKGELMLNQTLIFNIPVDEGMARFVGRIVKEEVADIVNKAKVL